MRHRLFWLWLPRMILSPIFIVGVRLPKDLLIVVWEVIVFACHRVYLLAGGVHIVGFYPVSCVTTGVWLPALVGGLWSISLEDRLCMVGKLCSWVVVLGCTWRSDMVEMDPTFAFLNRKRMIGVCMWRCLYGSWGDVTSFLWILQKLTDNSRNQAKHVDMWSKHSKM